MANEVKVLEQPAATDAGHTIERDQFLVALMEEVEFIIAARPGSVGATVSAGSAIYAMVDPHQVWVMANIDEDKVSRVHPGEEVEVSSVALGQTFRGQVEAVTPASATTMPSRGRCRRPASTPPRMPPIARAVPTRP